MDFRADMCEDLTADREACNDPACLTTNAFRIGGQLMANQALPIFDTCAQDRPTWRERSIRDLAQGWRAERNRRIRDYVANTGFYNRVQLRRDALHYGRLARQMEGLL